MIGAVREILTKYDMKYVGQTVPVIGEGTAKWMRGYRYVVIHIEQNETDLKFPEPGYYLVRDYSPHQCQVDFGIANAR